MMARLDRYLIYRAPISGKVYLGRIRSAKSIDDKRVIYEFSDKRPLYNEEILEVLEYAYDTGILDAFLKRKEGNAKEDERDDKSKD